MYKYLRILSHLSGIAGCTVAIYLLCNICPTNCVKFDYLGAIIGILAFLVTLLVAWNIYSAIGVEQRVNKAIGQQEENYENFRQEINSKIEAIKTSTSTQIEQQIEGRMKSAKLGYIALFNTTHAQVAAAIKAKDYLQQYSHYQTALSALLQCEKFPSDIRVNIKVMLNEMEELLKLMLVYSDEKNDEIYKLHDEDKKEFIQNMEEVSKSAREEFSFEDRQRFMKIAAKAKNIFDNLNSLK